MFRKIIRPSVKSRSDIAPHQPEQPLTSFILCSAIEALTVGSESERTGVRVSSGLAVFPDDGRSYAELLAVADGRMYGDKAVHKSAISVAHSLPDSARD